MTEAWKGFAGLVAVVYLAFYIIQRDSDQLFEYQLVFETEPHHIAETNFNEKHYYFYQIWSERFDENGNPYHYLLLRGEQEIGATVLVKYPERRELEYTKHFSLNPDQQHFSKRASNWTRDYNLKLAELIKASEVTAPPRQQ